MPALARNWDGLDADTIMERMADPTLNGGLELDELVGHVETDHLITWAWNPVDGNGETGQRTPAPQTHSQFVEALELWTHPDNGATCP